jgi:hypothetical protein
MLHDLLLGLLGFTGDVVQIRLESSSGKDRLELNPNLNNLETFEVDIIEGLLELGSMYMTLREFISSVQRDSRSSLYRMVISKKLESEILTDYEADIENWEGRLLHLHAEGGVDVSLCALRLDLWDKYWQGFEVLVDQVLPLASQDDVIDRVVDVQSRFRHRYMDIIVGGLRDCLMRELISWCKYGIIAGGLFRSRFFIRESLSSFEVDPLRVPSHLISTALSAKVLFCGRTVMELQNGDKSKDVVVFSGMAFPHFDVNSLPIQIEEVRVFLSRQLCRKLKAETTPNLLDHLETIRGVFLMGYGDRWTSFIEESLGHNTSDLFASIFGLDQEIVSMNQERLITYELPRPMDLVISRDSFVKYNEIFRLLYRITAASVRARYCYNMQLTNLYTSLLSYLQLDLIEGSFQKLVKTARTSEDVEVIASAHETFIAEVHLGSLVGVRSFEDCLDAIIKLSDNIARDRHMEDIVDKQVRGEIEILIRNIADLQQRTVFKALEKLALKLDYTNFYRGDQFILRDS